MVTPFINNNVIKRATGLVQFGQIEVTWTSWTKFTFRPCAVT